MTIPVGTVANTDTWQKLLNTVNLLANVVSNSVLTVGSNTVGDSGITGNLYANNITTKNIYLSNLVSSNSVNANSFLYNVGGSIGNSTVNLSINSVSLTISNSTSNLTISKPTATQVSNGQFFLNANGSFATVAAATYPISNNGLLTSGSNTVIIDTWPVSTYISAKYIVSIIDNNSNSYQSSEMLVLYNSNQALITEYAQIISNNSIGVFSTTTNATHVILNLTPNSSNTNVRYIREIM